MFGRRDHRGAHQRHVDRRDVHAVADHLGRRCSARTRPAPPSTPRTRRSAACWSARRSIDTLMMWPVFRSRMPGRSSGSASARRSSSAASCARSRGSGRRSAATERRIERPALFTSTSTPPCSSRSPRPRARCRPCPTGRPGAREPTPPASSTSLRHLLELLARARDQDHRAAGLADLHAPPPADPARGAGDQDPLALDGAATGCARGTGPGRGCAPSSPRACRA